MFAKICVWLFLLYAWFYVIFHIGGRRLLFDCFECLSLVSYSSFALIVKPDSFMFY